MFYDYSNQLFELPSTMEANRKTYFYIKKYFHNLALLFTRIFAILSGIYTSFKVNEPPYFPESVNRETLNTQSNACSIKMVHSYNMCRHPTVPATYTLIA